VVAEPDVRDAYTNLRVQAGKLTVVAQPTRTVRGLMLVVAPPFTDSLYGDRVRAEGKLQTPTDYGDFSYRAPKALILLPSAALGLKMLRLAQQTIDQRPGRAFA